MSFSETNDALEAYLGDRYSEDDWVEPRRLLFSGDADNAESLKNLRVIRKMYIPDSPAKSSVGIPASRAVGRLPKSKVHKSRRLSKAAYKFILHEAEEDDEDEEEEEEEEVGEVGLSVQSPKATRLPGPSAKQRLAATFDDMATRFEQNPQNSSQGRQDPTIENRMYLLNVQRTTADYIAAHLRKKEFPVTVSAWVASQLYVVADSPKTIAESLPTSLCLAVKDYIRITQEEHEAVERSQFEFPIPAWVRIKKDKYRGDLAQVFENLPNGAVAVLIVARDFPYPMPRGSRALVERSRLPKNKTVDDLLHDDQVVGWKYKGECYYKGLLLKTFPRDRLEIVASPHVDDIRMHLDSEWNKPFLKKTLVAFSKQFLRAGDCARVVEGSLRGELGTVISTDHALGIIVLESAFDGHLKETEVRLQDIDRIFRVGDAVRVIAGSYLGLEGNIVQMSGDIFHVCQSVTNEHVEVSKYYLDLRPLNHTLNSHLPAQQFFEPLESDSIQIGDYIEVLEGEHMGRRGVVNWFAKGDTCLWFRDILTADSTEPDDTLGSILVPAGIVQRTDLRKTLQFTKDKGYDVRPGDVVTVARGLEHGAKGVVQSVDFPNARLTLLCEGDYSIITVPITFVIKVRNAELDSFKKDIGQEVFIIGGHQKGFRVMLYSLGLETCTVAVHGQQRTTIKLYDVVNKYGKRLNGAMLEGPELISFCDMRKKSYLAPPCRSITPPPEKAPSSSLASNIGPIPSSSSGWSTWSGSSGGLDVTQDSSSSVNPISSTHQAWTIDQLDIQDNNDARAEQLKDSGPLPWLREFSSVFLKYHAMLKVSPIFDASLSKRFVSTTCPDPFCGENGPAPEDCVAAFCTSNSAGAAIKHYHIPAIYLSPAPPRKKNQECIILNGPHRGLVRHLASCSIKSSDVKINITPTVTVTLRFDQICLLEPTR
ncbi:uncharacterized protein F5891DRAFT_1201663 [Suillus fuscotomentosus]|uniref:KOW domain-containing protein n=1 Tax=Suillus fuscotomentosus TaxID=1912939 RepID=A0AAD4HAX0_9AGAM|nr:uncharacterized protein F5891DRAFT_1201663 [Suillus fuscotomentosus]KAG1885840.1 hypothetical protein F5891DRAFT_1201663 [Suillus fuscotomentosus]